MPLLHSPATTGFQRAALSHYLLVWLACISLGWLGSWMAITIVDARRCWLVRSKSLLAENMLMEVERALLEGNREWV